MLLKIYEHFTTNELAQPCAIYGNIPFEIDLVNAEIKIYIEGEPLKIKFWTYDQSYNFNVLNIYKEY